MSEATKMRTGGSQRQTLIVAGWLVLAAAAQVASLQLIVAGKQVQYQHYASASEMLAAPRLPFALILLLQAILVGTRFPRLWPRIRGWITDVLPGWRLGAVAILFAVSAAALSRSRAGFAAELVIASIIQAVAIGNVALAVAALRPSWTRRIDGILDPSSPEDGSVTPRGVDRFSVAAALSVTLVAVLLAIFSYERHPHIPDEVPYILHARYFAAGKLFLPPPPVPDAFDLNLVFMTPDKWYSPVPPGWPAVMALGALVGMPWIVNPLLAGASVMLAYALLTHLYPLRTARLALLLLCVSPWYLFTGMSFMTHMSSLTAALAGALSLARFLASGRARWAVIAGGFTGALSLIRPLEGVALAALLAAWLFFEKRMTLPRRFGAIALVAAGSIVVGALVFPYNHAMVGDAFRFPLNAYLDAHYPPGSNDMGFGANRGLGWPGLDPYPGHGAIDVMVNIVLNLFSINVELFGWASGSMMVLAAACLAAGKNRSDRMMLAAILTVAGLHSFYWFSGGPDFGARYWFLGIIPCVALAARLPELVTERRRIMDAATPVRAAARQRILAGMAVLSSFALLTFLPWRAIDKYRGYRGMTPGARAIAGDPEFRDALVLVRGRRHPDYASAAVYNPLDFGAAAPIFAWARSPEIELALAEQFPGRRPVILEGPSITGGRFRLTMSVSPDALDTSR